MPDPCHKTEHSVSLICYNITESEPCPCSDEEMCRENVVLHLVPELCGSCCSILNRLPHRFQGYRLSTLNLFWAALKSVDIELGEDIKYDHIKKADKIPQKLLKKTAKYQAKMGLKNILSDFNPSKVILHERNEDGRNNTVCVYNKFEFCGACRESEKKLETFVSSIVRHTMDVAMKGLLFRESCKSSYKR